jgi:hypothetical protein
METTLRTKIKTCDSGRSAWGIHYSNKLHVEKFKVLLSARSGIFQTRLVGFESPFLGSKTAEDPTLTRLALIFIGV